MSLWSPSLVPIQLQQGLIDSLARPGGTITGVGEVAAELSAKRLEILKDTFPSLRKIAMLWNADDLAMTLRYKSAEASARALGFEIKPLGVREPEDFAAAFAAMLRERPDAILMVTDALTALNRKQIFEFAAQQKLPAIYEYDFLVRDGGLMSSGPDMGEIFDRAADLADRILRGASPANLPFEQPTRFRLVIKSNSDQYLGAGRTTADDAWVSGLRRSGWPDVLWSEFSRPVSPRGGLCRQNLKARKTS
jgi:putative tryptophan/tyrosine transport system substrate-binding protein